MLVVAAEAADTTEVVLVLVQTGVVVLQLAVVLADLLILEVLQMRL